MACLRSLVFGRLLVDQVLAFKMLPRDIEDDNPRILKMVMLFFLLLWIIGMKRIWYVLVCFGPPASRNALSHVSRPNVTDLRTVSDENPIKQRVWHARGNFQKKKMTQNICAVGRLKDHSRETQLEEHFSDRCLMLYLF